MGREVHTGFWWGALSAFLAIYLNPGQKRSDEMRTSQTTSLNDVVIFNWAIPLCMVTNIVFIGPSIHNTN